MLPQTRPCFTWVAVYGRRKVYYIRGNQYDRQKAKFVKRDAFAPGFMVWAGISFYGKTSLIFINKGVKVNSDYYINSVLKTFLTKMFQDCLMAMKMIWCFIRTRRLVIRLRKPLNF